MLNNKWPYESESLWKNKTKENKTQMNENQNEEVDCWGGSICVRINEYYTSHISPMANWVLEEYPFNIPESVTIVLGIYLMTHSSHLYRDWATYLVHFYT